MENDFDNPSPEEKLREENELLRLKLQAQFGMQHAETSLDASAENQWLNYIQEWEKQFAERKTCRIYDFISRPAFIKADELNQKSIAPELERLTAIMLEHGVELSTLCEYEHEVIYRFITEEFFETEINDIRIPGMKHSFIFEEFHPNHEYDIRKNADEFIELLIEKPWHEYMTNILLASSVSFNDKTYGQKSFAGIIQTFQQAHSKTELLTWNIEFARFDLENESGELGGWIKYRSIANDTLYEGNVELGFKLEYGLWSVSKVVLPQFGGWSDVRR